MLLVTLIAIALPSSARAVDFYITRVSLKDTYVSQFLTARPGQVFELWATANKLGSDYWFSTTLRCMQSSNNIISPLDRTLGSRRIGFLDWGGYSYTWSERYKCDVTAPNAPGIYYYGMCIDRPVLYEPANVEYDNCGLLTTDYVTVTVVATPNLVVDDPTALLNTYNSHEMSSTTNGFWETGRAFGTLFQATLQNAGNASSSATIAKLFQSTNSVLNSTTDTVIATSSIPALAAGSYWPISFLTVPMPSQPGTYYFGVYVEGSVSESDLSDNWNLAHQNIRVIVQPPADPSITAFTVNGVEHDYVLRGGTRLSIAITLTNAGLGRSTPLPSSEQTFSIRSPGQTQFQEANMSFSTIPGLAPGETWNGSFNVLVPSQLGTFAFKYSINTWEGLQASLLDFEVNHPIIDNNTSNLIHVTVVQELPNIELTGVTVNGQSNATISVLPISEVRLSGTVRNIATSKAPTPETLLVSVSEINQHSPPNQLASSDVDVNFSGGSSRMVSLSATSGQALGTYSWRFCVESNIPDANYSNLCQMLTINVVRQISTPPDLDVARPAVNGVYDLPITVEPGETLAVTTIVSNVGLATATSPTSVELELIIQSGDRTGDVLAAETTAVSPAGSLASGNSLTATVNVTAPTEEGAYQYQVCATGDLDEDEEDYGNNCSTTFTVVVALTPLTIALTSNTTNISEGTSTSQVTVTGTIPTESTPRAIPTTIIVTANSDTAILNRDFRVPSSVTLVIPPGSWTGSGILTINTSDDNIAEGPERISLSGQAGEDTVIETTVTIDDNDVRPTTITLQVIPDQLTENSHTSPISILGRFPPGSAVLPGPVIINVTILASGQPSNSRFRPTPSFALTIPALAVEAEQLVQITTIDDTIANEDLTVNIGGHSSEFTIIPTTLTILNNDIAPPTSVSATGGIRQIALTWTASRTTASTSISRYEIQVSRDNGKTWSKVHTTSSGIQTSFIHTGLGYGETLWYQVIAHGLSGDSRSSDVISASTSVVPPGSPSALTATGSRNRVVLNWAAPIFTGGTDISEFRIEYSTDDQAWTHVATVPFVSEHSLTHRNLTAGKVFSYRITAVTAAGISSPSDVVRARTDEPYTANLIADINQDNTVNQDDALALYYAYTQRKLLGDGVQGGSRSMRRGFLSHLIDDFANPNDDDYRSLLLSANHLHSTESSSQLDVNGSGTVDVHDALIIYYSYTLADLLGDGVRGGFPRYRHLFLSAHNYPWTRSPLDEDLQILVRKARELRAAQGTP